MKTIKELVVIVVALGAGCVLTVGFLSLAYFCSDVTVYTPLVLLFVAALALAAASPADAKAIAISMSIGPALTFSFLFLQLLFEGRGFIAWGLVAIGSVALICGGAWIGQRLAKSTNG
jgi:hypothetical protein